MKTYILQLEAHDDITSARDKMGWGKSSRILVVWPANQTLLNRRLDLVLLKRHANSLGAQIALVSRDHLVRYHAPRLGIPVYSGLSKARNSVWRLPRRFRRDQVASQLPSSRVQLNIEDTASGMHPLRLARPDREIHPLHPLVRLGVFLVGVLSFLLLAAVLLPGAEIQLSPEIQEQVITIPVQASPEISAVQLTGQVPVKRISVVVEGRELLPASSWQNFPHHPANGEVVFTNLTDQPVEIPAGTIVRNLSDPAQRFKVNSSGKVPAGPGQTLTLYVVGLVPGLSGNLPAGSLQAIEGQLGTMLSINNPLPTRNGSERLLPVPTTGDRQELEDRLKKALQSSALVEMKQNLAEGDILIPTSIHLAKVLDQEFYPAESQPADELRLLLRISFEAYIVARKDLLSLSGDLLDARQPEGYVPIEGTLVIEDLSRPAFQGDTAAWSLIARRRLRAVLPESQAVQLALGLDPQSAEGRLAARLNLAVAPHIRLFPAWWPRLPYIPLRINVQVSQTDPLEQESK